METQPIGPGQSSFDPARAVPEPAAITILIVSLLVLLILLRLNRKATQKFKRGKLTPMPTSLKYGGRE
jgi:hypothetical protein